MDESKLPQLDSIMSNLKKKRSQTSRRPKPEGQALRNQSALSSPPVSDDITKVSSDENVDDNSSRRMFNLNQCMSQSLHVESPQCNGASGGGAVETRPKKVKLKVDGVTRSIHTKSNGASTRRAPSGGNQLPDNAQKRQRLIHQGNSDEHHPVHMDKKSGFQGVPWKDFSGKFDIGREDVGSTSTKNAVKNTGDKSDVVRKSRRACARRVDEDFNEDVEDDEIRYLTKLRTSKMSSYKDLEAMPKRKAHKGVKSEKAEELRDAKKSRLGDIDHVEEVRFSDFVHGGEKKKNLKKDVSENKKEIALTTRQRAILSKEDPSSAADACHIEFPNGLPTAPTRKRKDKLSEEEQQVKKAEAAQRRKLMNEKAARETEEEAIRKILGQDSSRKKKQDKIKKRQEELAHEKMNTALLLASCTVRTVIGPNGTTVTFPREMGFPKIFEPNLSGYPPPREVCAGPSCGNPYRYRDSKSRLPICSLQCYKAIHERMESGEAC